MLIKSLNIFIVCVLLIFVSSCVKDDALINRADTRSSLNKIEVRDGALQFENTDHLFAISEMITRMNDDELNAWANSIGFVSYKATFNKVNDLLGKAIDKADFDQIVFDSEGIITVENGVVVPLIDADVYQNIANAEGLYYVGGAVFKVTSMYLYSSAEGDVDALKDAASGLKSDGVVCKKYLLGIDKLKSGDVRMVEASKSIDKWACTASMMLYEVGSYDNGVHVSQVCLQIRSEAFKKRLGQWAYYKTTHSWKDIKVNITVPTRDLNDKLYVGLRETFELASHGTGERSIEVKTWRFGAKYTDAERSYIWNFVSLYGYFTYVEGSFSTRGIGSDWVELSMENR